MTPELVLKYAKPVPRYTSYPTAPQFDGSVGPLELSEWLGAVPQHERLSLYVHVPFCRSLCWFCGCHTRITRRDEPVQRYMASLLEELALVAERLDGPRTLAHVHLGGGSPSLLAPDDFTRIAEALHRHFTVPADMAFAIEIDPRTLDLERAAALARIGVNRASLGVQDFNPAVQRAVNRIQPLELTANVVGMLRGNGIRQINVDLMYGLPLQTVGSVTDSVGRTLDLDPDRIALFGYAHVPWLKKHQRAIDDSSLPGAWQRWCQARAAIRQLTSAGYAAIGLDHFARPRDPLTEAARRGLLRRNFQGYTTDAAATLIGIGTSAIGSLQQGYVQNTSGAKEYAAAIAAGRPPVTRGLRLTRDDRLRAVVIERLMCDLGVDFGAYCTVHGFGTAHLDGALPRLAALAADGLVELDGRVVTIPEEARMFVRTAASCFDAYLSPSDKPRHAQGV